MLKTGDEMRSVRKFAFVSVLVLIWPGVATAIQCKLTVSPINFGVYMPMTPAPVDVVGQITVRCQAQPGTFSVLIGPGLSGDQTNRAMSAGGAGLLYYNLYRDAARVEVWGDGTPPTFAQSGTRTQRGRPTFVNLPVYGRIFANQAPDTGVYNDNLLVTVLF
jgi:spore coat protein U-like protein